MKNRLIKFLTELADCPDIQIMSFPADFYHGFRFRGELTLPSGKIISAEQIVDNELVAKEDGLEYVENYILDRIGSTYIRTAYKERKDKPINLVVGNYYYHLRSVLNDTKEV